MRYYLYLFLYIIVLFLSSCKLNSAAKLKLFFPLTTGDAESASSQPSSILGKINITYSTLELAEGSITSKVSVSLSIKPEQDVTLNLENSNQLEISPKSINFTSSNWNTPMDIIVSATDDSIAEGNHTAPFVLVASSSDVSYLGSKSNSINFSITDNDLSGVQLVESDTTTLLSENGLNDSVLVSLKSAPLQNVTLSVSFDSNQIKLNNSSTSPLVLSFTPTNWNIAQTLSISAIDDSLIEGNHSVELGFISNSTDANYNSLVIKNITIAIADNDTVGIIASKTSLNITEGSVSDTFSMVLNSKPVSDVAMQVNFDSSVISLNNNTTGSITFNFTTSNWNLPQTITASAIDNLVMDGLRNSNISFSVSSNDSSYNSISLNSIVVAITDNDLAGISLTESDGSTSVMEGVQVDTYTITMNSQPKSNVVVTINFDNQLKINNSTTSPATITFTPTNWNTPQTVNVMAVFDGTAEAIPQTSTITHSISSSDSNYNSKTLPNVVVNITDNAGSTLIGNFKSDKIDNYNSNSVMSISNGPVDISKSFVYCNFKYASSNANYAGTCQLSSNGANVEVKSGSGTASNSTASWYIVEFTSGAYVQRGNTSLSSSDFTKNISISSIDPARTFVIVYSRTTNSTNNNDEKRTVKATLTSSNNLEITRNENGSNIIVEWQVIQLDGARVQSGTTSLLDQNRSVSKVLPMSVDLTKSFILFSSAAGDVNGVESDYYITASYLDSNTMQFKRKGQDKGIDISWFAIEMVDGTTVQPGSTNVGKLDVSKNVTISSANTNRAMIIMSNEIENGDALVTTQDSGTFSSIFSSNTEIKFERHTQENNASGINWFVVEFR